MELPLFFGHSFEFLCFPDSFGLGFLGDDPSSLIDFPVVLGKSFLLLVMCDFFLVLLGIVRHHLVWIDSCQERKLTNFDIIV